MPETFTNFALTQLASTMSPSAMTCTVVDASKFPAAQDHYIVIDNEIIEMSGWAANVGTVTTRGVDNTTAAQHLNPTAVFHGPLAHHHISYTTHLSDTSIHSAGRELMAAVELVSPPPAITGGWAQVPGFLGSFTCGVRPFVIELYVPDVLGTTVGITAQFAVCLYLNGAGPGAIGTNDVVHMSVVSPSNSQGTPAAAPASGSCRKRTTGTQGQAYSVSVLAQTLPSTGTVNIGCSARSPAMLHVVEC